MSVGIMLLGKSSNCALSINAPWKRDSALCRQSAQSLGASLGQKVHESLHDSAEQEQRFLTEELPF